MIEKIEEIVTSYDANEKYEYVYALFKGDLTDELAVGDKVIITRHIILDNGHEIPDPNDYSIQLQEDDSFTLNGGVDTETLTPKETVSIIIDSDSDGVPDDYDYDPYDPNIKSQSDFILIWLGTFVVIAVIIAVAYLWIRRQR